MDYLKNKYSFLSSCWLVPEPQEEKEMYSSSNDDNYHDNHDEFTHEVTEVTKVRRGGGSDFDWELPYLTQTFSSLA